MFSQDWIVKFVEHRVGDKRIIRLTQKWLKAGVLEDGTVRSVTERPGGLGDLTAPREHLPALRPRPVGRPLATAKATGDIIIVRYADNVVAGFEREDDEIGSSKQYARGLRSLRCRSIRTRPA